MPICDQTAGKTEVDGFPGRTYFSREEAESAALARAKWLIDESHTNKDSGVKT
jgi:hypothetical protein